LFARLTTHPLAWSCQGNHISSKAKQKLEGYLLNSQCCWHRSCLIIYYICRNCNNASINFAISWLSIPT